MKNLGLILAAVLWIGTASIENAMAWNRPNGAQGHAFFYINGNDDVPLVMKQMVWIQDDRVRELVTQTLPSSHIHIFSGDDYTNGKWDAALQDVANQGGNEPIDIFTLTHSDGNEVNMPSGFEDLSDSLFKTIPPSLKPRLRLFMNAGCEGARGYQSAFPVGFGVTSGSRGVSLGQLVMDDFLNQWLQGATVTEASARTNWECRNSSLWRSVIGVLGEFIMPYTGSDSPGTSDSVETYCASADMTVVERFPGTGSVDITSPAPSGPAYVAPVDPNGASSRGNQIPPE